jgi:K+ transporter
MMLDSEHVTGAYNISYAWCMLFGLSLNYLGHSIYINRPVPD